MLKKVFVHVLMITILATWPLQAFASDSFELKNITLEQNSNTREINGTICNTTNRTYKYVKFQLEVLDQYNNSINFISVVMNDFLGHSSRSFCESFTTFYPENSRFRLLVKEYY